MNVECIGLIVSLILLIIAIYSVLKLLKNWPVIKQYFSVFSRKEKISMVVISLALVVQIAMYEKLSLESFSRTDLVDKIVASYEFIYFCSLLITTGIILSLLPKHKSAFDEEKLIVFLSLGLSQLALAMTFSKLGFLNTGIGIATNAVVAFLPPVLAFYSSRLLNEQFKD